MQGIERTRKNRRAQEQWKAMAKAMQRTMDAMKKRT
jgi:hypothetical protein